MFLVSFQITKFLLLLPRELTWARQSTNDTHQSRRSRQAGWRPTQSTDAAISLQRLFFKSSQRFKEHVKKKSRAPAVKISVMETLFEKDVNKILLQKFFF